MNNRYGLRIADNIFEFVECELKARFRKKQVKDYLFAHANDSEYKEIVDYLSKNSLAVFPYKYKSEYSLKNITAAKDDLCGMIYIPYNNNKIYMKRKYKSYYRAKYYFNNILIEQDPRSPHRYTTDDFQPNKNSIIIDIGGAEGFFPLEYIDSAKAVYIFECDPGWNEALLKTYDQYSDKIQVINKFVSDHDDDTNICLDTFINEYNLFDDDIFIKIDAEGSEPYIIDGARNMLQKTQKVKLAVCCYHSSDHENVISSKFDNNWTITHSNGYMLYYSDYDFYNEPYVRRGVLRIERTAS